MTPREVDNFRQQQLVQYAQRIHRDHFLRKGLNHQDRETLIRLLCKLHDDHADIVYCKPPVMPCNIERVL